MSTCATAIITANVLLKNLRPTITRRKYITYLLFIRIHGRSEFHLSVVRVLLTNHVADPTQPCTKAPKPKSEPSEKTKRKNKQTVVIVQYPEPVGPLEIHRDEDNTFRCLLCKRSYTEPSGLHVSARYSSICVTLSFFHRNISNRITQS